MGEKKKKRQERGFLSYSWKCHPGPAINHTGLWCVYLLQCSALLSSTLLFTPLALCAPAKHTQPFLLYHSPLVPHTFFCLSDQDKEQVWVDYFLPQNLHMLISKWHSASVWCLAPTLNIAMCCLDCVLINLSWVLFFFFFPPPSSLMTAFVHSGCWRTILQDVSSLLCDDCWVPGETAALRQSLWLRRHEPAL